MTKANFVKRLSEVTEMSQKDISTVLAAISVVVGEVVKDDDSVLIPGIGTVKSKVVPERRGVNRMGAKAGEEWVKPEHKEGVIKIASSLKNIFGE